MSNVNNSIKKINYFASPYISLLEKQQQYGNNIGYNACNLTISFLSMNRVHLSLKLLDSLATYVPNYAGRILIMDNGSEHKQLQELKKSITNYKMNIEIIELGANYGVAGGRNKAIPFVKTEWLMFLDNDIYFINNPFDKIQKELSDLGCHFINLPLLDSDQSKLFALGGNVYLSMNDENVHVGGGSVYNQVQANAVNTELESAFFSTFLFGGASIIKKSTFEHLSGFDEAMFVGFEDLDFSIRLFREGYKIGNSTAISFVHDHPKPEKNSDLEYEKKRYSANLIQDSALHLEKKYGFKIWDENLINWIEQKNEFIGNKIVVKTATDSTVTLKKSKIALIVDTDNWAFGNIARQIKKNLSYKYDFTIITYNDCDWNPIKLLFQAHDCEILHFFWREMIPQVENIDYFRNYFGSLESENFYNEYFYHKIRSTSVYDHLFLDEKEISERENIFNNYQYYVCSEKLNSIYSEISKYPLPKMTIEDGVDLEIFYPQNLERFQIYDRPFVVGWVGNSLWASDHQEDFKGFKSIIKPAIQELKESGYNIVEYYADRNEKMINHSEMVNYYKDIDVLICMSKIEGTPNPVLEAMACGVPIITTDVGIVPQVLGEQQKKYIISRSTDILKESIIKLINDKNQLIDLSDENLLQIKNWTWKDQCKKFDRYFEELLKHR